MSVVAVGLEHRRAPLELLERVAVSEEDLPKMLAALKERPGVSEVVVLSTCLRTEIYAVVERFHDGVAQLRDSLSLATGVPAADLDDFLTVAFDDAVVTHLFEVAAGLCSALIGEFEVLGQVRRALERAQAENASGPMLAGLFRRAVQVGRKVRSSTAIAQGTTSLSHTAVELVVESFGGSLDGRRVAVVGAGAMGEALVGALAAHSGRAAVVVVNRTAVRARALARRIGGVAAGLDELSTVAASVDAILLATRAGAPLLDSTIMAGTRRAAGIGPAGTSSEPERVLVVDLGMPRNASPAVGELDGVVLLDMDDLRARAEAAVMGRHAEEEAARAVVFAEVERFAVDARVQGVVPVVTALRARLEDMRRSELARKKSRLASLDDEQIAEVDMITRSVLAKLLHQPTVALKEAAGTPRAERLVEALRVLFDL